MTKRKSKKRPIKLKSEKTTIFLLVIVVLGVLIAAGLAFFIIVDETGYFAAESQDSGSVIDTNSINLSYLDEDTYFTFPLEFSEQDIKNVSIVGDNIYILTSKTLICLSEDGNFIFSKVLNYSSPVLYSNSNYAIVYDEVGGYYIVFDEDKILYEEQIDSSETFLLAKVDEYCNILLVTKSSSNSSIFYMYDKNLKQVRYFDFTQEYIVSVDVYNGETITLLTISSQSGYFSSGLQVASVDSQSLVSYDLGSCAAVYAQIVSFDTILILTDSSLITLQYEIDSGVQMISENSIFGTLLNYYAFSDGFVIASQSIDDLNETIISFYSEQNTLTFEITIPYKALDVFADSKYIYVLTSQTIYVLNSDGDIHSELELTDSAFGLVASSNGIYHYSIGVLHKNEYKLSTQ